jgi:hypothetical protein
VLLKAERLGPAPDDEADWLVAQAAAEAAQRIEAASSQSSSAIDAANAGLERIEALLRRNGKLAVEPIIAEPMRSLLVFTAGVLVSLALAIVASANQGSFVRRAYGRVCAWPMRGARVSVARADHPRLAAMMVRRP